VTTAELAVLVGKEWLAVFGPGGTVLGIGRDEWEQAVFRELKRHLVDAVRRGLGGIRASNEELLWHVYVRDTDAGATHATPPTIRVMRSHWKRSVKEWGPVFSSEMEGLRFAVDIIDDGDVVIRVTNEAGPLADGEARLPGIEKLEPRIAPPEALERGRALLEDWCARGRAEPAYVGALSSLSLEELRVHTADVAAARRAGRVLDIQQLLDRTASAEAGHTADVGGADASKTFAGWVRAQWRKLSPEQRSEARGLLKEAKREGPKSWRWAALAALLATACGLAYYAYAKGLFRKAASDQYRADFRTTTDGKLVAIDPATGQESEAKTELRDPETGARLIASPGSTPSTLRVRADLKPLAEQASREHTAAGHAVAPKEVEMLTTWRRSDLPVEKIKFILPVDERGWLQPVIAVQQAAAATTAVQFVLVPPMQMTLKDASKGSCSLSVDGHVPLKLDLDVFEGSMVVYRTWSAQELSPGDHRLRGTLSSPMYGELTVDESIRISLTGPPAIVRSASWSFPKALAKNPPPMFSLDDAHTAPPPSKSPNGN
jgi:hypothetical protein